jgi:hypothetical protein
MGQSWISMPTYNEDGLDLGVEDHDEADPGEDGAHDGPEEEVLNVELLLEQRHVVQRAKGRLEGSKHVGAEDSDFVAIDLGRSVAEHLLALGGNLAHGVQAIAVEIKVLALLVSIPEVIVILGKSTLNIVQDKFLSSRERLFQE